MTDSTHTFKRYVIEPGDELDIATSNILYAEPLGYDTTLDEIRGTGPRLEVWVAEPTPDVEGADDE